MRTSVLPHKKNDKANLPSRMQAPFISSLPMARKSYLVHGMVQLLLKLVAPTERADDIVDALRTVMRPAQQARGCRFAGIYLSANDRRRVVYLEDWDDADELRRQFGTERFHRLLALLEMAADPPVVDFRIISETHGLEYISGQLTGEDGRDGSRLTATPVNQTG